MTYQIKNALIGYPGNPLLNYISMEIRNTEKIAIVGRNGCGKTTLLKVIAGKLEVDNLDSDEGFSITMDGNPKIGYLEQISFIQENTTVLEELMKVYEEAFALKERMKKLEKQMETDSSEQMLSEYAKLTERFECLGGYSYKTDIEYIFTKFGFAIEDLERPINTFSGGQKTRIAFVKLILSKPDIMLLDEPTNHLDMPTIEWLEGYLKNYNHAVVIVSHDRLFLDRIIDVTYEIEYKKMKRYPGNYSAFLERKHLDYEKQCKDYEAQQKEIARLTLFIEKWKNTPTKVAMTRSKRMQIEHMEKIPKPMRFDTKSFHTQFALRKESGKEVLSLKNLSIGYEEKLATVTFTLYKGQRLAVIGENGKGKSTLLKTIVGQLDALSGNFQFGKDVEWAYFDQELLNFGEGKTVIEEFWDAYPTINRTEVRSILGSFLFSGEEAFKPLEQLSGGEKVRLALAKLMRKQANLLILDEPTNHMDMVGKEALENMLKEYEGSILFVSHDRYFIKEIADNLLVFEESTVTHYPYGYEIYQEKRNSDSTLSKSDITLNNKVKKQVINPGKEKAKKERRLEQIEKEISETEELIAKWKLKYTDPEIATDFEKLGEINDKILDGEGVLEELLMEWAGLIE